VSEIDLLCYLMDEAFLGRGIVQSNESQALMTNLATVEPGMWHARPAGAARSIEAIARHVAECKVMYAEYAFGDGQLTWVDPEVRRWPDDEGPMDEVLAWLGDSHAALMRHVRALSDEDLGRPRRANWGRDEETRWLLSMLLQHDVYHAGEINHLRSLLAGDDRWRYQQLGFG
jgi:uncharacterized damage-inducible protein DinB